jgi:hypothetical protein
MNPMFFTLVLPAAKPETRETRDSILNSRFSPANLQARARPGREKRELRILSLVLQPLDQSFFFGRKNRPQVEHNRVLLDARDHGRFAAAQSAL